MASYTQFQVGDRIQFENDPLFYVIKQKQGNIFFGECETNQNFQFYYTNESLNSMGCKKVERSRGKQLIEDLNNKFFELRSIDLLGSDSVSRDFDDFVEGLTSLVKEWSELPGEGDSHDEAYSRGMSEAAKQLAEYLGILEKIRATGRRL